MSAYDINGRRVGFFPRYGGILDGDSYFVHEPLQRETKHHIALAQPLGKFVTQCMLIVELCRERRSAACWAQFEAHRHRTPKYSPDKREAGCLVRGGVE